VVALMRCLISSAFFLFFNSGNAVTDASAIDFKPFSFTAVTSAITKPPFTGKFL